MCVKVITVTDGGGGGKSLNLITGTVLVLLGGDVCACVNVITDRYCVSVTDGGWGGGGCNYC